jgi:uroporphyrin-III C-methyltransferase/precorrin-2 dehydrogenase/sirohydrochlorin ferrochelatase
VLARGTRPDAQSLVGRLDDIGTLAALAGGGPALLVIGSAVEHSNVWHAQGALSSALREVAT